MPTRLARSALRRPKGPPRAPSEIPKPTPGATKIPKGAPREGQRGPWRVVWRGKIDPESIAEAKKVNFVRSAPRPAPADARSTSPLPRSSPNQPRIVQIRSFEPFERLPRSTLAARRRLGRPRRATQVVSGRLGRAQGSPRVARGLPVVGAPSRTPQSLSPSSNRDIYYRVFVGVG